LIIETASGLPLWIRIRDSVLTAIIWLLYLWLMSDAFVFVWHLVRWLLGEQPEPEQISHTIAVLGTLTTNAAVIAINAAILVAWALYNQMRFRGRERRAFAPVVSPKNLSEMYGIPESEIAKWQKAPILRVHLADNGKVLKMAVQSHPASRFLTASRSSFDRV
jgi:biofilm PGA synthesis protein PgaD